ncbi:MAG TPA: extracellular solute-binding protein [Gaiellales bacterium]|nr:extracellular solute-binding protein [Gaiellales bacterium]
MHNQEEKPLRTDDALSRRSLIEKGAMVAAVSAVPMSKTRIMRGTHGQATTLKLMSWFQYEPGRHEAWNTMMAKFNKSQSKYKVVWTGWPANQYEDHVNTQVQAGGIDADVMTLIPDLAARLVKQGGVLEPINSIVKKVGVHPSASHNYIRKGGNLYGISIVEVAFGLLYNKALLAKAGIKRPATDPEQWLQQTVKLTSKPNQFGLYSPNTMAEQFSFWFTLQDWANAYDAKWAIGKKPNLTDPKIIKTLTVWKDFYDQTVPQGSNDAASARLFSNGQIAQELIVSAAVNIIKTTGPKIYNDLRSVPAPWKSGKQISRLHPLSIVKDTKNMEGAVAFVTFMTEPANMAQLMRGSLDVVPAFPEVLEVKGMKKWLDSQKWSTGYRNIKPVSQLDVEGDFVYHDTEFGQIILTNYQRALTGSTSVASAMGDAQKQAQALADRVF